MRDKPPLGAIGWLGFLLVVGLAVGLRVGFLATCCDYGSSPARFEVQGQGPLADVAPGTSLRGRDRPTEYDNLVHNLREHRWFGGLAPLSDVEEQTAHVAPGYFWITSFFSSDREIRCVQTALSVLTVAILFFFAQSAFASNIVAIVVGVVAALHPFWIVNTAELADGTLTTFLLAASLLLGTMAARTGGPGSSVLFGLTLAALALVRASMLPFSFLALGWFLMRCRLLRLGWFAGLLALLGFGNGLAPWMMRNQTVFGDAVPIVDSLYLHAWIGFAPDADGGPMDEKALRASLPVERVQELVAEPNQAKRYARLSHDVVRQVQSVPAEAIANRFGAAMRYLMGDAWFDQHVLVRDLGTPDVPPLLSANVSFVLHVALLALVALALAGWRLSGRNVVDSRLATIALVWIPIPFILTHAEALSGPRLPWDVPLVIFAGFAVAWLFPSVRSTDLDVIDLKRAIQDAPTRRV